MDGHDPVGDAEIDTLMRRFFDQTRSERAEPRTSTEPPGQPRRDFDTAFELLERASEAFDILLSRCEHFEADLEDVNERARAQACEQEEALDRWKRLASGLKNQVDGAEQNLSALRARCDAAEARTASAQTRAAALEQAAALAASQAAMAESLSTKLHDRVLTVFGIGSRAHPVLEAVATKAALD